MQQSKDKITEIIFLVEEEGSYIAQALGHSIFTQADDLEELKEMVKEAVECHFDENKPNFFNFFNIEFPTHIRKNNREPLMAKIVSYEHEATAKEVEKA